MTKVAVVMRTYERPVLLARALASVAGQAFNDYELVVVNNGGEPSTVEKVVGLSRVNNVRVLHLDERVGMEAASNAALATCSAEYFAIHDDDDAWLPEFLEHAVARLDATPDAAAVVTGVTRVYETMRGDKVYPVREEAMYLDDDRLTLEGMIGHNPFPPIAALFRFSLLETVGMFDDSLPVLGDWEFNLRAVTCGRFVHLDVPLARYHTRTPDSDVAMGNSITVGVDLHRTVKKQLQQRWLAEPAVNGINKGELALREEARLEKENARREAEAAAARSITRRLLRAVTNPAHGVRAIRRRLGWGR